MKSQIIVPSSSLWFDTVQQLRHDIYQLPEYVALEANRTNTISEAILISAEDKIFFAPYLIRSCKELASAASFPTKTFDIISPYGYPGILMNAAAVNPPEFPKLALEELKRILAARGVCSGFFRLHPILNHNWREIFPPNTFTLNGETVSVNLKLSSTEIWHQTHSSQRNKINKCKRLGMTAKIVSFLEYIDEFATVYQETMERVGAANSYFLFDRQYFLKLQKFLLDKIHLCIVELDGEIASAGIYTECSGIVQGLLGGTRNKFYRFSPSSLETDYVRFWARERGNEFLHLGGGVGGSRDSLYQFKASFSQQRHEFLTLRLIIDSEKYDRLVKVRAELLNTQVESLLSSNFFPAYRATI
ncbi:GNAT family N-acetyltransferase [Chroococcidiopsis sp. CCNUC1]|uniref:GNAT family N-acetyltransferase n=1 Tax=Chroococcidiopsis sp. CCNUC1 TaxID=2653189 RepID=UPI00201FD92B|nr:GNAT family N-acetyltransferase [Chroococcidiopsis sp. CCNUC1]URD51582.1 peptidoglycan bridge formation glycyltransferase FemA/FemB family protein [Chroococcidiopsis sp. CCNUC1]